MRISHVFAIVLMGGMVALPVRAPAQVSIDVTIGKQLGPEISIFAYSQTAYGNWRTSYRQWTPVTIYVFNGHYYRKSVKGARAVMVYRRNNEYFLPPQEKGWVGFDKRYNYSRQPVDEDRGRAKSKDENRGRGRGRGNP